MYHLYVGIRSFAIFGHSNQLSKPPQWVSATFLGKTAAKHQTSDKGIQYYLSSWPQLPWRFVKLDCQCLNYQNFHRVFIMFDHFIRLSWFLPRFLQPAIFVAHPSHFVLLERVTFGLNIPPFSVDFFRVSHTPPAYSCGWSTSDLIQVKSNVSSMMQRKNSLYSDCCPIWGDKNWNLRKKTAT